MKTKTIAWTEFPWQVADEQKRAGVSLSAVGIPLAVMVLASAGPAHASGWVTAKEKVGQLLDYVSYGDIVFCGGMWMFGHRNKALDLLLSCGIGTVIIRHADDIENFFKSI